MDAKTQIADDLHLLAAPFQFLLNLVKAAVFLAIFPLVILGLCIHAVMIGGPIMTDDMWLLTKVLFCVLAPFACALIAGVLSKGSLTSVWAKEFLVLIASFALVAGLIRLGLITFNDGDHAPAIWTNPAYDYSDTFRGGSAFKIGSMEDGKFEFSYKEIQHLRSVCSAIDDASRNASCVKGFDCMKNSGAPDDWKARHCDQVRQEQQ
jgi:hypothetical protein